MANVIALLRMDALRLQSIALGLLCLAFAPAHSSEPLNNVIISDGAYVGYASVAEALAALKAQGLKPLAAPKGLLFAESDLRTSWTFANHGDPAYPAVAKVVYNTGDDTMLHVEVTILCEAADAPCAKFRSGIRADVEKFSMILAAGPSTKCREIGDTIKCSKVNVREHTNQQIYVQIQDDGTCTLDRLPVPCLNLGKQIRASHPSDDPQISVCGSPTAKYYEVAGVLRALDEQDLVMAFGCPPH
jgi:biopolymer transport protein ExbD